MKRLSVTEPQAGLQQRNQPSAFTVCLYFCLSSLSVMQRRAEVTSVQEQRRESDVPRYVGI